MKRAPLTFVTRLLTMALVVGVCTGSSVLCVAHAEDLSTGSYEDFVQRGVSEFEQGHWEEAHAMFLRAHELQPNARTFRGIGMSAYELRSYVESSEALAASLSDTRKPLTADQRVAVTGLLQRARDFVVAYDVALTPPHVELSVDGQPATLRNGKLLLDAGTRVIVARAVGYEEQREQVRVVPGTTSSLVFELRPKVSTAADARLEGPVSPHTKSHRPWTWALAGSAVAAGAVAVAVGVVTQHKHDELERCNRDLSLPACSDHQGPRFERATNASIGLASALAVGAVVAIFVEGRRGERATTRVHTTVVPLMHGVVLHTQF
jgi:hypothetical protein